MFEVIGANLVCRGGEEEERDVVFISESVTCVHKLCTHWLLFMCKKQIYACVHINITCACKEEQVRFFLYEFCLSSGKSYSLAHYCINVLEVTFSFGK